MARIRNVRGAHSPKKLTAAQRDAMERILESPSGELNLRQRTYYHIHLATLRNLEGRGYIRFIKKTSAWKLTAEGKEAIHVN